MAAQQDVIAGGHYIIGKPEHQAVAQFVIKHFGTGDKISLDEWKSSFPVYMEKVKMKVENKVDGKE